MVGLSGIEPLTSRLSGVRSNHLSYRPPLLQAPHFENMTACTSCVGQVDLELRKLFRKEVIQPHLPVRLPCYDLVPVTSFTFGALLPRVRVTTSGTPGFHHLTGGVYKAWEHIHRGMLIRDY